MINQMVEAKSYLNISVIGLGYIGLPTASIIAAKGGKVVGVDTKDEVVEAISLGEAHIYEPGLNEILKSALDSGNLKVGKNITYSDVFIITVPTPVSETTKKPNLDSVFSVVNELANYLTPGNLVIVESTCPVGTTEEISKRLSSLRPELKFPHDCPHDTDVNIAYCPERVLPGSLLSEFLQNDRVIGGISSECSNKAKSFYLRFIDGNCHTTDSKTAELTKLSENCFRDVNIAFANELSIISEKFGVNATELIKLANLHPRVSILKPSPGVGGHCIAVDPWFVIHGSENEAQLISCARNVNLGKTRWVVEQIIDTANSPNIKSIVCLGLSYKPNTDDFRESPSLSVYHSLRSKSELPVFAIEPFMNDPSRHRVNLIDKVDDQNEVLLVCLVGHDIFVESEYSGFINFLNFSGIEI